MKANELRIGNYLNTIYGIKKVSDISVDRYCWFTDSQCEPIPLTEEWLLKFGFEKGSNIVGDCYYIERDFGVSDFVLNITKTSNFEIYELDLKIDYVHQLQNLYFALTGEELTIKE